MGNGGLVVNDGCTDKLILVSLEGKSKEGEGSKAKSGGIREAEIEFEDKLRSKEAAGAKGWLSEFEVNELEKIKVDLGVAGMAVDRNSVGDDAATSTGGDPLDSLKMISTSSTLTGKRMSRHAKMSKARIDSAMVPTKPMLKMATMMRHNCN